MKPELITLFLNILFLAFLVFGFLFGLKGLKKATSSLCTFIIAMVVILFLTGPISYWVLNMNIKGKSLEKIISDAVTPALGNSIASSEVAQNLIKSIPVMLVSIVVCILLIFVLGLIFKIIGSIVYRLIFGKDDKKVVEKVEIVNDVPQMTKKTVKKEKHRLLGGLVGLVHGFLLAIVIFLPLTGLVNIVTDITGVDEVSAETFDNDNNKTEFLAGEETVSIELKPSKELIKDYLPEQFYDYAKALDNSIIAKIGKVGNMSEKTLNLVARCSINGYTIKLGDEIRTLVGVYDEFVDFTSGASKRLGTSDLNAIVNDIIENPNNYDFNKLYTLCDHLFESNLVKAIGNDGLKAIADSLVENNKDESLQPIYLHLQTAVNNYCANKYNLKDDAKALLGVLEVSAKSGLIKAVKQNPVVIDDVSNILLNNSEKVLKDLSGKISSSNLLQKMVIEATNYGSSYLQDYMNDNIEFVNDEKVALPVIDGSKDIHITSTEITKVLSGGLKLYQEIKDNVDLDAVKNDFYKAFDYDVDKILNLIGDELDTVVNMSIIKDSKLFINICDAMSNSKEYSKYLSFNELSKGSNIKDQFSLIAKSAVELKNSELITYLKNYNDENKDTTIDSIITQLNTININNETLSTRILKPILSCSILQNTIIFGLDTAHDVIESAINEMVDGEEIKISALNTNNIMSETYRTQILDLVNKFVAYAKDIKIKDLKEDLMDTLLNSNLENLGSALDVVKTSKLFSSNGTNTGAYTDIVTALNKSKLNEVLDFSNTTNQEFSWKTELTSLKTTIDTLNEIEVIDENGNPVGLISYVMNGGDFNKAYDYLNAINVQGVKPLFEISLVKPVAITIINTINAKIKEFVGEDLGAKITDFDKTLILKENEPQQITDVIAAATEIDFTEDDLDNIDKLKLNYLLSKLEINAKNDGVFKESYNALLLKTANMINENIKSFANVGNDKITTFTSYKDVLNYSQNIIEILNSALDTVKAVKSASFKDIDTNQLFVLINALRLNSEIADGIFKETYNTVMIYIVNKVNEQIADFVGTNLASEIVIYKGTDSAVANIGDKYNYIKEIIECAVQAYKAIPEGKELQDIDSTTLGNLLDALNSFILTRPAYNALNNKLANIVIEQVNSITGKSISQITEILDLSSQSQDIKDIIDVALDVVPALDGKIAKVTEMTEEDKANMLKFLETVQENGEKENGVFKPAYDSLVEYIAEQNGTTAEIIKTKYGTDGKIDWNSFING